MKYNEVMEQLGKAWEAFYGVLYDEFAPDAIEKFSKIAHDKDAFKGIVDSAVEAFVTKYEEE